MEWTADDQKQLTSLNCISGILIRLIFTAEVNASFGVSLRLQATPAEPNR
jgi:hypothetical protein